MPVLSRSTTPAAGPSNPTLSRPIRPPVFQPPRPAGGGSTSIIVNPCQRGNTVLDAIKNVPWEYGQIAPDYQVGATTGVLFLSLRYHRLHPEYIHTRIGKLEGRYMLRVLLMMCDVTEHEEPIRELTKVCLINNLTIMVAWTPEEAGLYLSTYKLFEHKPPDRIKERVDKDYTSLLRAALTSIRGVNKTDVTTLSSNIGSVAEIAEASEEALLTCPGFGEVKSRRVVEAFQRPFRNNLFGEARDRNPSGGGRAAQREETLSVVGEETPTEQEPPSAQPRNTRQRAPSPEWDDFDLDDEEDVVQATDLPATSLSTRQQKVLEVDDLSSDDEPPPKRTRTNGFSHAEEDERPRRQSPEWDIDLDLN
ncbi:DNA repair protein rad10 [Dacryopinax primogenitus]|uniref:DNA excision repair protein ERCC-1 n=1 Tax=Dacryopinax primogenitus (strain DJM 731) TaxID=1858805 RepID=M5G2N5_DACPD|nr:DNA repair protein rad10 [Dacryopinax primogenitus]EJU04486.1 DNA repair protein rad10 [Dacryopinax primogenitus]